jgi:hypothetical protein
MPHLQRLAVKQERDKPCSGRSRLGRGCKRQWPRNSTSPATFRARTPGAYRAQPRGSKGGSRSRTAGMQPQTTFHLAAGGAGLAVAALQAAAEGSVQ